MKQFTEQVGEYEQELISFVSRHELPGEWLAVPDHLAVKYANSDDYELGVKFWKRYAEQVSCIEMDGRRLATANLSGPMSVGAFGEVHYLEIMEPRPEKAGHDIVGLEHMEFYFPHFERVTPFLHKNNVDYTLQHNPSHRWVNIVINEAGQELKINDRPLADIVAEEVETWQAHIL